MGTRETDGKVPLISKIAYGFGDVKDAKLQIDRFADMPIVLEELNRTGWKG